MIKLYLITGFLGAGKTTFLKNVISLFDNEKLSIIVNEFGKEGIDGQLLSELNVHLDEINNGSIFCSCRLDKFENVLIENISNAPDVILVEASGLSDPTNIKKILSNEKNVKLAEIEYMGCICLVDALNFKKVFNTARVCKKQISTGNLIIINKIDVASDQQVEETSALINSYAPNATIKYTSFGKIEPSWLNNLATSQSNNISGYQTKDVSLQSYLIEIKDSLTVFQLNKFLQMFIEDTFRIKGFVKIKDGVFLVDCTSSEVKVKEYDEALIKSTESINKIVVLSGAGMSTEASIKKAVEWYSEYIISIE